MYLRVYEKKQLCQIYEFLVNINFEPKLEIEQKVSYPYMPTVQHFVESNWVISSWNEIIAIELIQNIFG